MTTLRMLCRLIAVSLFLLIQTHDLLSSNYNTGQIIPHAGDAEPEQARRVIYGKVTDENKLPLTGVHVGLLGTSQGVSTNTDGKFLLEGVPSGLMLLKASMVGYEDYLSEIRVKPGESIHLDIRLQAKTYLMDQVSVIAGRKGIFEKVPGSLSWLDKQQIISLAPVSGNEVIRRSPGVHIVDEEGLGLRINIGIRGLDPDRSRTVLVMEDGIPVSLAPYGEPEMYYTPAIDRMEGIEVLKGSGSILYGPQTIGGVVNYITADPPLEPTGTVSVRGAEGGFFSGLFSYGDRFENTGYQVNFLRKQADSVGISNYRINDLTAKIQTRLGEESSMVLRLGFYDEVSNATYVGITQSMYDYGGKYDFARLAPDDMLGIRRYSASLTHNYFINKNTRLSTSAYGYTTSRNWQRQDFAYNLTDQHGNPGPRPSNFSGVLWGDETISGGAIYMRNSTGNRNRQFEVAGLESRMTRIWRLGDKPGEFKTGVRYLYERAFEQRINGAHGSASSGSLQDDEIRTGQATSAYLHNQIDLSHRLSVTSGMRVEHFSYERDIRRGRFSIDGQTMVRDTLLVAGDSLTEVIPGVGFNINLKRAGVLFGGLHRGFAPPRVKDAVSNQGFVYQLDAEKSWNYELGLRQLLSEGISVEVTGFLMDFSNQVIPVAESAGGTGAGLVNGGSTIHGGVEMAFVADFAKWLNKSRYHVIWDGGITLVDSRFSEDRYVASEGERVNIKGNKTPYAPAVFANTSLLFSSDTGLSLRITTNHVGEQFTDVLNRVQPSANGRSGLINSYTVIDANLSYYLKKWGTTFTVSGKNLTDKRYIVTRRPQGIRLGLPRMITVGIRADLHQR